MGKKQITLILAYVDQSWINNELGVLWIYKINFFTFYLYTLFIFILEKKKDFIICNIVYRPRRKTNYKYMTQM